MFFIGSTGPILTLLLTILLPFFLVSIKEQEKSGSLANGHSVIHKITNNSEGYYVFEKISVQDKNLLADDFLFLKWEKYKSAEEFPDFPFRLKQFLIALNDSGNKAPPVFC